MAKTHPPKASEPLNHRAVNLVAEKHYIKDAFVAFVERGTLHKTSETVHRFRVASYSQANGPHYVVVLNEAGEELSEDRLGGPDAFDFPGPSPAVLPRPIARARAITVDPSENHLVLNQQEVHDEVIVVSVPADAGIPKADVYFLADTTNSMFGIINQVKQDASNILSALNGLGLDLTFGVGNYKDFPGVTPFQHQVSQTNAVAAVTNAISAWVTGPGGDIAEGQFFALDRLAESPGDIGWRAGAKRIVVWIGDAPGHDPVCAAISGLADDVTEATVTAKLVAEQITVLAISVSGGPDLGLDDDPVPISEFYEEACGAPGGAAGQATRIANATNGQFASGIDATSIAGTIVELVEKAVSQINNVRLIAVGATAPFVTAITPPGGHGPLPADRAHTLDFRVTFTGVTPCREKEQTFNGTLDVAVDGSIAAQKHVAIKVPPC